MSDQRDACRLVDRYLLGEPVSKPAVIEALLADRSQDAALDPFYRALAAVGVRAADESLVAVRLLLAGREASDGNVRRLRALSRLARSAATGDRAGSLALLSTDAALAGVLGVPGGGPYDLDTLGQAARRAYFSELGH